jgi:acetyl esterase/lipase
MPVGNPLVCSRRVAALSLIAGLTACTRVELLAANVPALFGSYTRKSGIAYGPGPQQQLDLYLPSVRPHGSIPLVVFWYGGRWSSGDKSDYRFVGAALAGLGFAAVLPNYRHYPLVKMPGFMEDAARAALWAAAHANELGADPNRLYLMGHSAGAHMAALLALDSRYFNAVGAGVPSLAGVMGLSGPYDFLPLLDADTQDIFGPPDLFPVSQPINFARSGAPPMLLMHGLQDDTVAPKNSRNLASALNACGVPASLRLYHKAAHADTVAALSVPARGRAPVLADIAAFVNGQATLDTAGAVIA